MFWNCMQGCKHGGDRRPAQHILEHGKPHDLEEDERSHLGADTPLEDEGEGGHDDGGDEVAVDDEDEMVHAALEGGDGDDVHPGEPNLEEHHRQVRLHVVHQLPHAHGGCRCC